MAFFAVLTLVPSTVAVGSALALLRGIVGPGPVADAENGAVRVVRTLMGPDLSEKVIAPFIHAQLSQPKGGVAIGGLLAAWWLSSHLFMATSHAVDLACLYRFSPNVKQTWAECLAGACAGAVLWILAAAAFRFAAALGLHSSAGGGRRRPDRRDHRPGRQRRGGDRPVGLSRERGDPRGRGAQRRAARRPGARGRGGAEGRGVSAVLNDVPRVLTSHGQ
jgi:hypothetical protein